MSPLIPVSSIGVFTAPAEFAVSSVAEAVTGELGRAVGVAMDWAGIVVLDEPGMELLIVSWTFLRKCCVALS